MVGALAMLVTLTVGTVVALTLVYCVVRYAVRDGIIDARRAELGADADRDYRASLARSRAIGDEQARPAQT
ncbi:hypothetical protein EKO23_23765 [Nocardioides guangzhouensis]|uniref:Uncharacterized protein n=1 Tax=Nocardioides guangzhouensis TaxID=2497878 RepID=A0A4Q4Z226_9ACTN|nr:hypothetical protein [Nocardioides guangzhouensis]RYP81358.1 hypothetical protein EKO23_23765 [Nocardioides guangzhouensis]